MGGIAPILTTGLGIASSLASTVNTINTIANTFNGSHVSSRALEAQQAQALSQLQAKQALAESQKAADIASEKATLAAQLKEEEADRRRALKNAVAKQRAAYGSSGVSSGDGSAQAVLLGMFEESEDEKATNEKLNKLRSSALDQELSQLKSVNMLQAAQLQEQQSLARAYANNDRWLF